MMQGVEMGGGQIEEGGHGGRSGRHKGTRGDPNEHLTTEDDLPLSDPFNWLVQIVTVYRYRRTKRAVPLAVPGASLIN